jgi:hypothetical protein
MGLDLREFAVIPRTIGGSSNDGLNNNCFVAEFIDVTVVFTPVRMVGSADSGRVVVILVVVVAVLVSVLFDGDVCLIDSP